MRFSFLDAAWILVYLIGKSIAKPISGRYARLAPFLLMTCEGGSVALPLYIALVGAEHAVNIITFDRCWYPHQLWTCASTHHTTDIKGCGFPSYGETNYYSTIHRCRYHGYFSLICRACTNG